MALQQNYGTGRRKSSTARVFLRAGSGKITVNGRPLDEFFGRETAPPRLAGLRQKLDAFRAFGIAHVFVARFDAAFAALTPHAFIEDVLVRRLGVRWVLVGDDFRFGKGRAGKAADLQALGARFGFEVRDTLDHRRGGPRMWLMWREPR